MQAMETGWPPPELLVTVSTTHAISFPMSKKLQSQDTEVVSGMQGGRQVHRVRRSQLIVYAQTLCTAAHRHCWRLWHQAADPRRTRLPGTPPEAGHVHVALEGVVRAGAMWRGQIHRDCALGLCICPAHSPQLLRQAQPQRCQCMHWHQCFGAGLTQTCVWGHGMCGGEGPNA